ncbi:MAG: zinc dependent phospholipase C family protein [Erysipelotrichaceae bacterium]|nr:zinc dependent phospholipase C family protein [Erysipelotrichaceae bacterium]
MPAGYTHLDFGKKVFSKLNPTLQNQIEPFIDYYNIGVHGPDILFYHKVYVRTRVNKLGSSMHYEEAYPFFLEAKKLIKENSNPDAALVYILGFITHFTLDSTCHPYIYQIQDELNKTHSEIESELDREIIVRKGKDPLRQSMTKHLQPSKEIYEVIAPFFHLTEKEINETLHWMIFYLNFIRAPGKIKRGFVFNVMKIAKMYDKYSGLLISYQKDFELTNAINELINKEENAVDLAVSLINEFVEHLDDDYLNERFKRNYE